MSAASGEALGHLDQAITQLNVAIEEIRIFIEGLSRESVDIGDFTTELTALVHALNLPSSTEFEVTIEPKAVQCLTQEQALHLLNIARESMRNCVRHAQAKKGRISRIRNNGGIKFTIQDNGMGFEHKNSQHEGQGLKNMQARVNQIRGRFHISSQVGKGTHVVIQLSKGSAQIEPKP